ncbi:MAG TPA: hypothetical protein VK425_09010, partial [Acidimicrobiales bacterium]|nr:hypothetical protein [Acidimicrobiales bacterium]
MVREVGKVFLGRAGLEMATVLADELTVRVPLLCTEVVAGMVGAVPAPCVGVVGGAVLLVVGRAVLAGGGAAWRLGSGT